MVQVVVNVEFFFRTFCIVLCICTFSHWGMLKFVSRTCRNVRMNTTSLECCMQIYFADFAGIGGESTISKSPLSDSTSIISAANVPHVCDDFVWLLFFLSTTAL